MTHAGKNGPDTEAVAREAAAWFARLRATSVTAAERAAFAEWLRCSAAHRRAYAELEVLWTDPAFDRALRLEDARLGTPLDLRSARRLRLRSVLLPLGLAVLLLFIIVPELQLRLEADHWTATGERRSVVLADGSTVTLNTSSAIAVDLSARERRVRLLRGEALFEVHPGLPFVVAAGHTTARALGTRFVVRSGEEQDRVSVVSGVVEVRGVHPDPRVALRAGREVTVGPRTPGTVTKVAAAHIDAWTHGWLVFENSPLAEVIAEVSRYRRGAIVFGDPKLKGLRVNGRFHLSHPEHILDSLEQTLEIRLIRLTPWLVVIG